MKPPLDAFRGEAAPPRLDAFVPDSGVPACSDGEHRCRGTDPVVQTCQSGQWRDTLACDYACRAGACVGECDPGIRRRCRANSNVPQACDWQGTWVDELACSGATPYCASGQCVAACLNEGEDCSAVTSACCAGTECIATDGRDQISPGSGKLACKAIPACAGPGLACTNNTDCCASMDCTGGRCMPKQAACLDSPADGVCGGTSGATCCPGTECKSQYSFEQTGCIPSTAPTETGCPRDQPVFHEACRASKIGLHCTYQDWVKQPGIFFSCTCSYHGWSCSKGYYVH